MVKVGINGFGRIGRNVLRAAFDRSDFQVEAINDLTDSKTLAHLLKYDSLSGTLAAKVEAGEGRLLIDGRPIRAFSERDPGTIPWKSVGVDDSGAAFDCGVRASVCVRMGMASCVVAPGIRGIDDVVAGGNDVRTIAKDSVYLLAAGV